LIYISYIELLFWYGKKNIHFILLYFYIAAQHKGKKPTTAATKNGFKSDIIRRPQLQLVKAALPPSNANDPPAEGDVVNQFYETLMNYMKKYMMLYYCRW
jgi:hypothetical protein